MYWFSERMFFPFLVHPTRSLRGVVPARVLTAGLSGVVGLGLATQSLVADLRPKVEMKPFATQLLWTIHFWHLSTLGC